MLSFILHLAFWWAYESLGIFLFFIGTSNGTLLPSKKQLYYVPLKLPLLSDNSDPPLNQSWIDKARRKEAKQAKESLYAVQVPKRLDLTSRLRYPLLFELLSSNADLSGETR